MLIACLPIWYRWEGPLVMSDVDAEPPVEPTNAEPPVNWRLIYWGILGWLVVMIVLMRIFTEVYS